MLTARTRLPLGVYSRNRCVGYDPATVAKAQLEETDGFTEQRMLERVLREVGESFLNFQVVATREAETITGRRP